VEAVVVKHKENKRKPVPKKKTKRGAAVPALAPPGAT